MLIQIFKICSTRRLFLGGREVDRFLKITATVIAIFYAWLFLTSRAHMVWYDYIDYNNGFTIRCHYFTGFGLITNRYNFGDIHRKESLACPRMIQFSVSPKNLTRIKTQY